MGVLRTPQLRGLHDTLWDIVDSNLHDNDRAKGAVAIEGAAGLGKSTAVEQFAKEFHLREVAENGPRTGEGNERWPVCRVTLSGHPTLRDLNVSLLHFFAHPGTSRGNAADFARRALDTFLACQVRLLVIDDLHFLRWRAADGVKVSNHLKYVANEFPVTLVLVGVGLTDAGLFTEGRTQRESTLAQTARRTTRLSMEPFASTTAGQKQWRSVLHAIEARVVLVKHREGTLSVDLVGLPLRAHLRAYRLADDVDQPGQLARHPNRHRSPHRRTPRRHTHRRRSGSSARPHRSRTAHRTAPDPHTPTPDGRGRNKALPETIHRRSRVLCRGRRRDLVSRPVGAAGSAQRHTVAAGQVRHGVA